MKPGDIVQIIMPGYALHLCLAVIEEVRGWGVVCYVKVPANSRADVVIKKDDWRAYTRLNHSDYARTGGRIRLEETTE